MTGSSSNSRPGSALALRALLRSLAIAAVIACALAGSLLVEPRVVPTALPHALPRPPRLDVPYRPSAPTAAADSKRASVK